MSKCKALRRLRTVGKKKEYFIPLSIMTNDAKRRYEDFAIDFDETCEDVEDILGDISIPSPYQNSNEDNSELIKARLENLQTRTKLLQEKIEERKVELFTEWSERFFEVFSNAFAKFKNHLINLHLNEKQINALNASLDSAIENMSDNLIKIQNEYMNDEHEE